ncbi:unnamed protein product, partial [Rotaria magnacalcarata]
MVNKTPPASQTPSGKSDDTDIHTVLPQTETDYTSSQWTEDVRTDESTDSDYSQSSQDKAVQTDNLQAVDESSGDDNIQKNSMNDLLKNKTLRPNKKQYQNRRNNKKDKFKQLEDQINIMNENSNQINIIINEMNRIQDEQMRQILSQISQLNLSMKEFRNCESHEKYEAAKDELRLELNLKFDNFNEYEQSVCFKLFKDMNITLAFDEIDTNLMEYLIDKTESICREQKMNKSPIEKNINDNKSAFEAKTEVTKKNLISQIEHFDKEKFDIFANMVKDSGTSLNWWALELGVLQ